jgi:hypothetical protein
MLKVVIFTIAVLCVFFLIGTVQSGRALRGKHTPGWDLRFATHLQMVNALLGSMFVAIVLILLIEWVTQTRPWPQHPIVAPIHVSIAVVTLILALALRFKFTGSAYPRVHHVGVYVFTSGFIVIAALGLFLLH